MIMVTTLAQRDLFPLIQDRTPLSSMRRMAPPMDTCILLHPTLGTMDTTHLIWDKWSNHATLA